MRLKLFNLTTVFLATSGLLAPVQVAFGRSLPEHTETDALQHLVCVKEKQHLLCDIDNSEKRNSQAEQNQGTANETKATGSNASTDAALTQIVTPTEQESIANLLLIFIYLVLPSGLGLGIFLHNRYCVHRAAAIQKQIALLEKLWQHGSDNDATTDTSTSGQ